MATNPSGNQLINLSIAGSNIVYQENGEYTIFVHIIQDKDKGLGIGITAAENSFYANIQMQSQGITVLRTASFPYLLENVKKNLEK